MIRKEIIELILEISNEDRPFDVLEGALKNISPAILSQSLLECGTIPELFDASSSEEKLWAKYCDILLAHAWTQIGIPSEVLRARGDSADVFGRTGNYTIVGDAKAFRLSRTAKNQKDYKITALDDWRKSNTYASLVSPLFQYPKRNSQIYQQAIQRNVTLLSYVHLKMILDHYNGQDVSGLWALSGNLEAGKDALDYWKAIDTAVCKVANVSLETLAEYKDNAARVLKQLGQEGIRYWQDRIEAYQQLSQQEAVARLIKSEKIEAKIKTIRQAVDIRPLR